MRGRHVQRLLRLLVLDVATLLILRLLERAAAITVTIIDLLALDRNRR